MAASSTGYLASHNGQTGLGWTAGYVSACDRRAVEAIFCRELLDRLARQSGGERLHWPADADVSGHQEAIGHAQKFADFVLGSDVEGGEGSPDPFGAEAEQDVLHERVDRGAAADLVVVDRRDRGSDGVSLDQYHQVHRNLIEMVCVWVTRGFFAGRHAQRNHLAIPDRGVQVPQLPPRLGVTHHDDAPALPVAPARREPGIVQHSVDDLLRNWIRA